jgi:UDP-glucose 4-epimerase
MTAFLVTGGCGFIGQSLIARLLGDRANVLRVVDDLSTGRVENLRRVAEVETVAASALRAPRRRIQLAVGDISEDPRADCLTNVIGTFNYLEGARAAGVRRFVFASSGATVGECEPPIHELVPARPVSPYGASKLAGEAYCSAYARTFGLATVALRFGNVYGPGSEHKESVVAKFIRRAFAGQPLQIYGDGAQTRDFIYIDDLTRAIERASAVDGIGGEAFQIATARETTVGELAQALTAALAAEGFAPPRIEFLDRRPGEVLRNFADTRKAAALLGWSAEVSLPEGLRRTVRWAAERAKELPAVS